MKREYTGSALVVLAAISFGLIAIFVKMAYAGQINLITTLSTRFIIASIFIWIAVWLSKLPVSVSPREMLSLFLVSMLGYGCAGTFFFASLRTIPSSLAALILFIHPILISLFEVVVYKYPLTPKKLTALSLSTLGLVFVLGNVSGTVDLTGILLALAGGFSYGAYILYSSRVANSHHPLVTTAFVLTFPAIVFTLYGLATGSLNYGFPLNSWIWLAAMALVSTCLGILFLFAGLRRINAGTAGIIGTLEVVVTVLFSALIFGDLLTPWQMAGGVLILAGIISLQIKPGLSQNTKSS
jgi:drug/metabolite transporter (DMT)-like permease